MPVLTSPRPVFAVVLAGGRSRRMSGRDKVRIDLDGRTALARVLAAVPDLVPAGRRIVVGPEVLREDLPAGTEEVRLVREEPAFGGPVAALERGVREIPAPRVAASPVPSSAAGAATGRSTGGGAADADVLVLGGDMPLLQRADASRLLAADPTGRRVRVMIARSGRREHLCAVWPRGLLRDALDAVAGTGPSWEGLAMRDLYARLGPRDLLEVPAVADETADIDTPEDLASVRDRLRARES